jgi:hypothetical protein
MLPVNHSYFIQLFQLTDASVQNATMLDRSRIHEVGHVIDEHRDMRLDVDNMTYEELVALEEQIGDVNTGLTESFIQENLRSTFYVPRAAGVSDEFSELSSENDACIICQVNLLPCSLLNYNMLTLYIINQLAVT